MGTVVRSYTSGTSAIETAPAGAVSCTITAVAGGGGGGYRSLGGGGGGGGAGSYVTYSVACSAGNTATYTVGFGGIGDTLNSNSGDGTSGGNTTVVATSGFSSFALITCNGGAAAASVIGAAGGVAGSGPGTHTAGADGFTSDPCVGEPTAGGGSLDPPYGNGGFGFLTGAGGDGAGGRITFTYTTADGTLLYKPSSMLSHHIFR